MRLVNASTLELEEFVNQRHVPKYAILSHTWGKDEVLFHDLAKPDKVARKKEGWKKIRYTCDQALQDGLYYVWVDTCCKCSFLIAMHEIHPLILPGIDKSSSAELSEAINSMFAWYRDSVVCYVYLSDVVTDSFHYGDFQWLFDTNANDFKHRQIRYQEYIHELTPELTKSRWFTRGWTLQELLAPRRLELYSRNWSYLGSAKYLIEIITSITSIKASVIEHEDSVSSCSVACRMSWAARCRTTRIEDEAYCLLGLFGINMPLLYGEGEKAFLRLQKEIIQVTDDQTILACEHDHNRKGLSSVILARSAASFAHSGSFVSLSPVSDSAAHTQAGLENTLSGVQILAPVSRSGTFAVLNCIDERRPNALVGLQVAQIGSATSLTYSVSGKPQIIFPIRNMRNIWKPRRFLLQDRWGQQSGRGSIRRLLRIRCVVDRPTEYRTTVLETYPSDMWRSGDLCRNRYSLRAFRLLIHERPEGARWPSTRVTVAFDDIRGRFYGFVQREDETNRRSLDDICSLLTSDLSMMKEVAQNQCLAFNAAHKHHWFKSSPYKVCMINVLSPVEDIHANLLILIEKEVGPLRVLARILGMLFGLVADEVALHLPTVASWFSEQFSYEESYALAHLDDTISGPPNLMLDKRYFCDTAKQKFTMQLSAAWPSRSTSEIVFVEALASATVIWACFLFFRNLKELNNLSWRHFSFLGMISQEALILTVLFWISFWITSKFSAQLRSTWPLRSAEAATLKDAVFTMSWVCVLRVGLFVLPEFYIHGKGFANEVVNRNQTVSWCLEL